MTRARRLATIAVTCVAAALVTACTAPEPPFDVVFRDVRYLRGAEISTERVHVGVRGDRIAFIGTPAPAASRTIDGRGLVLAPGFLDTNIPGFVHADGPAEVKVRDGVTSYLSAHGGLPGDSLARQKHPAILNYGTTVGLVGFREQLESDPSFDLPGAIDVALRDGAYGVSFSPEYSPQLTTPERVQTICAHLAGRAVPVSFHARFSSRERELEGIEEAVRCAEHGTPVHVLHITSTGATWHPREAAVLVAGARSRGLTVLFDFYPYTSWASSIQRARFEGDWLARYHIGWDRVRVAGIDEPVDAARVEKLRKTGKQWMVVVDSIPQATLDFFALQSDAPIGSDTTALVANAHPRGAGSFARFLRTYVRPDGLTLGQALHRFSTAACDRFAPYVPDLAQRGKIAVGHYADLVLWDPDAIRDNATIDEPLAPSSGVVAALVNGVPLVVDGEYVAPDEETGRWMRGRP